MTIKSRSARSAVPEFREQLRLRTLLRAVACGVGVVYVLWNCAWLLSGEIPPSMLLAFGNIPAPTSGMTRSLLSLAKGDYIASLCYNPLALPTAMLYGLSLYKRWQQEQQATRLRLGRRLVFLWIVDLALAWVWVLCFATKFRIEALG